MVLQSSPSPRLLAASTPARRFLVLSLPFWATDYLKRVDPALRDKPLGLFGPVKGGLRMAALDPELTRDGLRLGQNLADARAIRPDMVAKELDRPLLSAAFDAFADWHSNASPLVSVLREVSPFGDLVLDITGVDHLFGGEAAMLGHLLTRLRRLGYRVRGAIAPTIGAAWAVSHYARSQVVTAENLEQVLDALPVHGLRLTEKQAADLGQMGLAQIGQVRLRPRKPLQARFGALLLTRLDQAFGLVAERLVPRLPVGEHGVERRLAEPIARLDDVLGLTANLADDLSALLEGEGLGAQAFHLFLYRVDHKVMTLSLNAARLTRDARHITDLFRHRAQRLEGDYDAGFGIDMVRLMASGTERLDAVQAGAFAAESGLEDVDRLNDRLSSRLGVAAVLKSEMVASRLPERAVRLVPVLGAAIAPVQAPLLRRPLRLLPVPEPIAVMAEVPDGLPASMLWRQQTYRLVRGEGPERLGAEWWRTGQRLKLVEPPAPKEPAPGETPKPPPHVPDLPLFEPDAATRDYYVVEDQDGRRFWVFRQGFYTGPTRPAWYLHGFFP
ncbi:MAG: DNA polymerase Y family protein [Devosia sp.]|uniref:Y-family DNA polymerase n=1 Tax=Devosia sp. TaxID=1871048 RepID=UPI0024C554E3|nr:DNA polymerase Y family protein [Devosia sp.]UYN98702.1 MAG: DNA polymerase Y family protein [Devosia sp.]